MKKIVQLLSLFIFLTALLFGYRAGLRSAAQYQTREILRSKPYPGPALNANPIPTNGNGWRVVLLIVADDFYKRQPHLHSLWLITYKPSEPQVVFFPIFPHFEGKTEATDWQAIFKVEANRGPDGFVRPSAEFLEALAAANNWWSGYVLVDEFAVEESLFRVAADDPANLKSSFLPRDNPLMRLVTPSNPLVANSFETRLAQHDFALHAQVQLYQEICWQGSQPKGDKGLQALSRIFSEYPQHAVTDLNSDLLFTELRHLRNENGALLCDFPTISNYILSSQ